ncbi:MAG: metal ABC transporter permease [Coleofasciculaceae cyanobacterium SM2_1_6]|nr:metal ABC transporter permease [Coleofasciculaceae cyanobacterium SM2_1_6]
MINWFLEPLQYEFMRNALGVGILLGILCAVVGTYLIVRQLGMMAHAIAHSVLPGLSIAFFLKMDLSLGAFIAGIISAWMVAAVESKSKIKADTAISLVLSGFLALGVTLITTLRSKFDLFAFLFGDILSVSFTDVISTGIITFLVLLMVKLFYKELLFYTFDPLGAQASGLPVNLIYFGFIGVITLTVIASMQTVGVLLVLSLLIAPGAIAYLLVKQLHLMMMVGALVGVVATISGMYLSYYQNLPSGAAIVLVISTFFILAFLFSPSQGVLIKR